ncbi:MAG: hypothetical protein M0C28_32090 [Candidatus Moduliflexus flocculans]|nr:hypothetical protein [Candidatus Moduliflexus flocculans]
MKIRPWKKLWTGFRPIRSPSSGRLKGTSGIVRVHHLFPGAAAEFNTAVLPRLSGKKSR